MFEVRWDEGVEEGISRFLLVLDAADIEFALARLAHIDELLRSQADRVGESAAGNHRRLISPPLGFEFEVDPDFPFVWVHRVWWIRYPSK